VVSGAPVLEYGAGRLVLAAPLDEPVPVQEILAWRATNAKWSLDLGF